MSNGLGLPKYANMPFRPPRMAKPGDKQRVEDSNSGGAGVGAPGNSLRRPVGEQEKSVDGVKRLKRETKIFMVTYRKATNKKNKTWDGDGYGVLRSGEQLRIYNGDGKPLGTYQWQADRDMSDVVFRCGAGWECQLDYEVTDENDFSAALDIVKGTPAADQKLPCRTAGPQGSAAVGSTTPTRVPLSKLFVAAKHTKFKPVIRSMDATSTRVGTRDGTVSGSHCALFDKSQIDDPLVMNKASDDEVEVVVDPLLSKKLRQHQRTGIKFMYDCIRGLARPEKDDDKTALVLEYDSDVKGCLLADEMGLGKTCMTIALIWTLLKQHPRPSSVPCSQSGVALQGMCQKVLVVCPVTLIGNWKREFMKWLPMNRIGILTLSNKNTPEKDKNDVRNFLRVQRTYQVLILGYEKVLNVFSELEQAKHKLDFLVCDEGHRLKNSSSKILKCLTDLEIERKVILTGTPIQNDLNEFYTIINFINPGILGTFPHFKRVYITPITRARDVNNKHNEQIVSLGESRSQDLIEITKKFILRRTSSIIADYLPPKTDLVVFCKPTQQQIDAFNQVLVGSHIDFQNLSFNSSLGLITLFKKICNSPSLVSSDSYFQNKVDGGAPTMRIMQSTTSGKLKVLMSLLHQIAHHSDNEKVVIISNYTQTLDIIGNLMSSANLSYLRLDGSTPTKERDAIVNDFNRSQTIFGFLLSAKSGGVGLNLVGASRLILFDNDWNPSVDLQAMSRIHRDGQKRPCFIYRLVTTGCIDEKIFQRQLMKHNLSKKFLDDHCDEKSSDNLFEQEDLKDLFNVQIGTLSNTHDLLCSCEGTGEQFEESNTPPSSSGTPEAVQDKMTGWMRALDVKNIMDKSQKQQSMLKASIMKKCLVGYRHINPHLITDIGDHILERTLEESPDSVTFAFVKGNK
ncbi:AaceriAGL212Wp [[Ashbya] aceris (nom. inval.)]|nr:AaceriAGL212Wp [[Ashbya] aceris (nom. inval.)]